jgi:hypothetical protein
MRNVVAVLAIVASAGPAAASEQTDVMAVVHQFIDGFNKGDTKTALATCASPASILDEFPPYAWQGATACSDWASDFDAWAKKNAITDPVVKLAKPKHLDIAADRAYVVVPASFSFKQKGKPTTESGSILTVALQKSAAGWHITGWAWSKH